MTAIGWTIWQGMTASEAMREASVRMDGYKMNFVMACFLVTMVGGSLVMAIHLLTCGLGFPIVMLGQLMIFALVFIQTSLLYDHQHRRLTNAKMG